jgi:hypothetical protein
VTAGPILCEGFKLDVLIGEGIVDGPSVVVGDSVFVGPEGAAVDANWHPATNPPATSQDTGQG